MKQLLKYAKNLEQDFTNPNATYQSKIDLAVTSLVMGDYDKSKQMFDAAIELDSMYPSAWLGKAFVEIAKVDDDHFNSLEIDEYLNRALRSNSDITAYKVALAGCLAYRHAVLIKKYVQAVETAIEEQKKAKQKAMTGLVVAAAGTMFTGGNKSITSNIVGGALIGGGVTTAISSGLKSMELEKLGNSIYSAALGQTYLSIPIIRLCESLTGSNIDNDLKHNFNTVVDSWKDSVSYLMNKQKLNLVEKLTEWQRTFLDNPIAEIEAFQMSTKMTGLTNQDLNNALSNYSDICINSKDKFTVQKRLTFYGLAVGCAILLIAIGLWVLGDMKSISQDNRVRLISAIGIVPSILIIWLSKPKELKKLQAQLKVVQQIKITGADIHILIK
jgi:tetratricopeptide (TPR) repeat protein